MSTDLTHADPSLLAGVIATASQHCAAIIELDRINLALLRTLAVNANNFDFPYLLLNPAHPTLVLLGREIVPLRRYAAFCQHDHRCKYTLYDRTKLDVLAHAYLGCPGVEMRDANYRLLVRYAAIHSGEALPQQCRECGKVKIVTLMTRLKTAGSYNGWYWACDECLRKRCDAGAPARVIKPSPVEVEAIRVAVESGEKFQREYRLADGKFVYDLFFPKLWLLVEVDGASWHDRPWQRRRDLAKEKFATDRGFLLVRVRRPDIAGQLAYALEQRRHEVFDQATKSPAVDLSNI